MKQVSEHHHECAAGASSFREMADCGRRGAWPIVRSTAAAATSAIPLCSDVLCEAVAKHQTTEVQAKQKFVVFKAQQPWRSHDRGAGGSSSRGERPAIRSGRPRRASLREEGIMRSIICATTLALATTAAEFLWQTRNCRSSCREPEAWCRT
jgi:hypothetical protein